jgi:hypothetical protein
VDPELPRGVVRRRDDARAAGVSAHHEGLVAELRMLQLLDRGEERIEIEVRDDLRRTCHD